MLNEAVVRFGCNSIQGMQRERERGGRKKCHHFNVGLPVWMGTDPNRVKLGPTFHRWKKGVGFVMCLMFLLSLVRRIWKCVGIEVTHSLAAAVTAAAACISTCCSQASAGLGRMSHSKPTGLILIRFCEIAHLRCLLVTRTEVLSQSF